MRASAITLDEIRTRKADCSLLEAVRDGRPGGVSVALLHNYGIVNITQSFA